MLVVRTNHDAVTFCLYQWTSSLLKLAESKRFNVISIDGEKVTKENIKGKV